MTDTLFFAVPTQSVAIRLLVGAVVAAGVVRLVLGLGLRAPRVRVAASQVPALALVAIGVASIGAMRLPSFVVPLDGSVTFARSYEQFSPVALPALLGAWFAIVAFRVGWRLMSLQRLRVLARESVARHPVPAELRRVATRLAAEMHIEVPTVGVSPDLPGGAVVIGVRRPVVLLDRDLVRRLDIEELQGVLAHEFSHVRRHDNLIAFVLCLVGDITFFVPGGRWSRRQLLVERELATDDAAVEATGRPGALASGLLKVVESSSTGACAAFMPQGTLVRRIEHLVDARPAPSRARVALEGITIAASVAACVLAATAVPRAVAGDQPESAVGLAIGSATQGTVTPNLAADAALAQDDGLVFEVYDLTNLSSTAPVLTATSPSIDDSMDEMRPERLRACAAGAACAPSAITPALRLRPLDTMKPTPDQVRWRIRPVVETNDVIRIYFLSQLSPATAAP